MFQEKAALFIYSVSPVHMGAGTSLGIIDNPIQRERHTSHPMIAGSGLKGALRHHAQSFEAGKLDISSVFGPETDGALHAGAVSFSDAQIVLFPVRSLRQTFVYTTCPTALARLRRLLFLSGYEAVENDWEVPFVEGTKAIVLNDDVISNEHLVLEAFNFAKLKAGVAELRTIADWIGDNALPTGSGMDYFVEKIRDHLVLLPDDKFNYFMKHSTIIEPHVRIDDATGTASDGGLFYTENYPPESLMVSLAMASRDRSGTGKAATAKEVLQSVRKVFDGQLVQMGGDSTTGRGQVVLKFAGKGEK